MHYGETWFPSKEDSNIVGRVTEAPTVDIVKSQEVGKTVNKFVPVLESKFPGSIDVSVQAIKPHNRKELTDRFPGSWAWYEKMKSEQGSSVSASPFLPEGSVISGTPLHEADFIPRDKIAWLATLGFTTIEQVADMADMTVQNIKGSSKWRKQAIEFLKRT